MTNKTPTGSNNVPGNKESAIQHCPNCGSKTFSYFMDLWQCQVCHCLYGQEHLIQHRGCIQTKRLKAQFQTFYIHQINEDFWVECTDSANQRYQHMLPFSSFKDAVDEAKWFHQEFSGDPAWLPHDWSYVGLGMNRIDLTLQFKMHLGSPSLTLITMNGEKLHLFDEDALAIYRLISKGTEVRVFNLGFTEGFDRQVYDDIEIDLDDF